MLFSYVLIISRFKVIGKKYAVRRAIPETHENQGYVFSFHILPRSCMDLPGSGEVDSDDTETWYVSMISTQIG